ncbi:hypothetical protein JOB18_044518 [Solea senegalensis]|uniref:Uncharacterized protein n=1 Tax=Solea senegalensis TaxID=28829 RepID=A0AAV6PZT6_SOLSE|nr:hypothetical protein JOB18_044518 [Solea senegalensis]
MTIVWLQREVTKASYLLPVEGQNDWLSQGAELAPIAVEVRNSIENAVPLTFSTHVASRGILIGALKKLMDSNTDFKFTYRDDPDYGPYLESVNGLAGDDKQRTYWELLVETPDGKTIRPEVGIGCYIPSKNEKQDERLTGALFAVLSRSCQDCRLEAPDDTWHSSVSADTAYAGSREDEVGGQRGERYVERVLETRGVRREGEGVDSVPTCFPYGPIVKSRVTSSAEGSRLKVMPSPSSASWRAANADGCSYWCCTESGTCFPHCRALIKWHSFASPAGNSQYQSSSSPSSQY